MPKKHLAVYALIFAVGSGYAALISTAKGRQWVDQNTTASVVIGNGLVITALRFILPAKWWRAVLITFAVAGLPMVIRKLAKGVFL